jgi:tetratricopeptide (TPR) repeat protein
VALSIILKPQFGPAHRSKKLVPPWRPLLPRTGTCGRPRNSILRQFAASVPTRTTIWAPRWSRSARGSKLSITTVIAVADAPGSATANLNLGLTLAEQGQLSEAQQYLETSLRLAPELYEAHLKLGELLLSRGQASLATLHLRKAAQSPDPQVRNVAIKLLKQ